MDEEEAGPRVTAPDWAAIRTAYEKGGDTLAAIAKAHGVSTSAINVAKRRHGWTPRRRRSPVGPEIERQRARREARGEPATPLELVARLTRALGRHLTALEQALDDPALADTDKTARTLSALAQVLDRLTELAEKLDPAPAEDETATRAEHDRLIAALAERLARKGQSGGAGPSPPHTDEG